MSDTPRTDANELQREQVERLIESTAELQKQILRRFANSAIEELRYHYRVERTRNEELERENSDLRHDLTRAQSANTELATENADLKAKLARAQALVNEQANDDGLWFMAKTLTEAYLQQKLRDIHRAVEAIREAEESRND